MISVIVLSLVTVYMRPGCCLVVVWIVVSSDCLHKTATKTEQSDFVSVVLVTPSCSSCKQSHIYMNGETQLAIL